MKISGISCIHVVGLHIMLKNKKSKNIRGTVKFVNQHIEPYVNSPFSLEFSFKGNSHFRFVSKKTKAMLYVFISMPV